MKSISSSTAKPMVHQNYRPDIDGLRAVAVLSVVFFHAFHDVVTGGFVGVDVFFVISGFLISSILFQNLERGSFSFVEFYVRRIKRIFPALIVVLIACYIFGWFRMFPAEFMALGRHIAAGALFVSNFALWQEAGYFDAASTTKPLLHLWSLAIEEQFYLLWPVLAFASHRLRFSFIWVNLLIVGGSFAIGLQLIQSDPTAAFYSPLSRFWEIGIGSIAAWTTIKYQPIYRRFIATGRLSLALDNILSIAGCSALAYSVYRFDSSLKFPGYYALLPTIGTVLVIAAGPGAWLNRYILGNRLATGIGLISYPIYLWHWPLLTALQLSEFPLAATYPIAAKFGVVTLSILLAWLSYRLVETPVKALPEPRLVATATLLAMLAVGGVGAYTHVKEGIASRIPAELRDWAAITNVYGFFSFPEAIRETSCHIGRIMPENFRRSQECFTDKRPLLMIWGDSYAAALYPGLQALSARNGFGIDQVTVSNAPPFYDTERRAADNKTLTEDNDIALAIARRDEPDVIVMTWMVTGMNGLPQDQSVARLAETIEKIRSATPTSRVIVIGPVPLWDKKLAEIIVAYLQQKPMGSEPEKYSSFGLRPEMQDWDRYFSAEIPKTGAIYISAYDVLCNDQGCLTHLGSKATDLTAVDTGHLTPAASRYLIDNVGSRIVAAMRARQGATSNE